MQFWSNTQLPSLHPSLTRFLATSPWPWPKETRAKVSAYPCSLANLSSVPVGSAPLLRMKIHGTELVRSLAMSAMVAWGAKLNSFPILSATNCWTALCSLSSFRHLRRISLLKASRDSSNFSSGSFSLYGFSVTVHAAQASQLSSRLLTSPEKGSDSFSSPSFIEILVSTAWSRSHCCSEMLSGLGFFSCSDLSTTPAPRMKRPHSSILMSFLCFRMAKQMSELNKSLCLSKRPLQMFA
mmetsp:Transcript_18945/g.38908  ORF Transcript_18945/g.38908 Transcript_18945/m.38908 type:complete len:239 (-) Transcript_18945:1597-2313(-)